jgi:uncharacterized protein
LLDALRGFALTGVLLANLNTLTLYAYLSAEQRAALPTPAFDHWMRIALVFFVSRKFLTLFSFLFGLSFAVQLMRAEARGADAITPYVRRLLVLLLIGLAHGTLLWWGDVLRFYAILGMGLLLFRRASARALLGTGLALTTVGWALLGALTDPLIRQLRARLPSSAETDAVTFAIFSEGRWADVVWRNPVHDVIDLTAFWYQPVFIFGVFLLGVWTGRQRVFHEPEAHRTLLRRVLAGGLALGLAGNTVWVLYAFFALSERVPALAAPAGLAVLRVLSSTGYVALGLAYASGFALLFLRSHWRRRLEVLAPVGRMALTNYLMHAVVCVPVFYGFGLGVGPRAGVPGLLVTFTLLFGAQVILSRWWLARFRFGPAEWGWRSLTYRRLQSMR